MTQQMEHWLAQFVSSCKAAFGGRLAFVGLQGSHARGEANASSDIDMVVILDEVHIEDLKKYREIVDSMPDSEKACGFCSGKQELLHWPRYDLFQLVHDTKPLYGSFLGLVPMLSRQDVLDAIHNGAAALYHAACHSFLYNQNRAASLCALYKGTFFLLQAMYFYKTQLYITTKQELSTRLSGKDAAILNTCMQREHFVKATDSQLENAYQQLLSWCSELLTFA